MLKHRVFNVVVVKPGHGVDMAVTDKIDKTVKYTGFAMKMLF
jgi:hypothetical protein